MASQHQFGGNKTVTTSNPFQTVAQGAHYLAAGHAFHAKGTTSINGTTLGDLKKRTTQAPVVYQYPTLISGNVLWSPRAARYVSGSPDLGYHYDPLDYLLSCVWLENGTLRLASGTSIGMWPTVRRDPDGDPDKYGWGLALGSNANFVSQGHPTNLNRLLISETVQEQYNPEAVEILAQPNGGFAVLVMDPDGVAPHPRLETRFTDFAILSPFWRYPILMGEDDLGVPWTFGQYAEVDFQNTQFRGGCLYLRQLIQAQGAGPIRFHNCLFDRAVSEISLWHSTSLEAYNCLFRGGELRLSPTEPVNNWVFKDNLFHGAQLTAPAGLTHDYNGYWLSAGQPRLWPDGPHDRALSAAPAYLTGQLGGYYLSPTSPLYNAGSRSPGEAGLAHYTTRTDQRKERDETEVPNNVNIGLHYVAATGGMPKDSDGDGLLDYCEDGNGNGDGNDDATSWQIADTDGDGANDGNEDSDEDGVNDKTEHRLGTDPADPEEDYDQDGNPNPLELHLGTDPLLADSPISIVNWADGAALPAGEVTIQVQIRSGFRARLLNLTANSEAISGLQTQPSTTDTWLQGTVSFTINTARLRNGVYEIRPVGLIDNGSGSTLMQESLGPVLRLRLQNELTFAGFVDGWGMERVDEWAEDFSAVWQINAVSAHPQCEYKIAIFDSADRLLYHTENAQTAGIYGTVDYEWDLVQDDGQTYSPPDGSVVYAHVTTFWPNEAAYLGGHPGSGSSGTVRTPPSENISPDDDWPDTGSWIIAVQSGDPKQVQLMDEFAKAWDENYGVLEGGLWALPKPGEPGSKREMSKAYRLPFDAPDSDGWAAQAAEWRFLQTSVLPEHTARNMWLIAHGGPSHMGGDFKWMTSVDSWKVCDWGDFTGITEKETSSALGFAQGMLKANHYYRFVFLDGCETARELFWPGSFGIPKQEITTAEKFDRIYLNRARTAWKRRPSAFVGWTTRKYLGAPEVKDEYVNYRRAFRDQWIGNKTLIAAFAAADDETKSDRQPPDYGCPEDPGWGHGRKITGWQQLRFSEYNKRILPSP